MHSSSAEVLSRPLAGGRSTLAARLCPPVRYMGTKRSLAPVVRSEIDRLRPRGRIVDLFAGVGSVAQAMASDYPVLVNDALLFTGPLAKARFVEPDIPRPEVANVLKALHPAFWQHLRWLEDRFEDRLAREVAALGDGRRALADYLEDAAHAGNSTRLKAEAAAAAGKASAERYLLVTLYFSAGYLSTRQAMELDALRLAIDQYYSTSDWLLAAWIASAAAVVNGPGHTAQFLKPTSSSAFNRVRRQWARPVWTTFASKLETIRPVGNRRWRIRNRVYHSDALKLLAGTQLTGAGAVYADPPYSKDQYSRFYHLYETLFLYDFPACTGKGRYREGRFTSRFFLASKVESAFLALFKEVAELGLPLLLSYPAKSLLSRKKVEIRDLISPFLQIRREIHIPYRHSTMGASGGRRYYDAREQLFVCIPS